MSLGKEIKAAFGPAVTWGQAVSLTQDHMLLIRSESVTRSRTHLPDDSAGQEWASAADQGLITCGGALGAYLRYSGLERLLAMAMGVAPAPEAAGEAAFSHALAMSADLRGVFGTLAIFKGFSVHQCASAKIDGMTITGKAGQPLEVSFDLICDDLAVNTTSGANTSAALSALAAPTAGGRVLFRQGEFYLNDRDAGALAAGDRIAPSGFTLSVKRGQSGDYLAGGGDAIAEPLPDSAVQVSLQLEFPTYSSDVHLADLGADVRKKMRMVFTGGEIEDGVSYSLELLMPHVVLTDAQASIDGAGRIKHPVSAALLAAPVAPAGMSGVSGPLAINLTSTLAASALA